MLRKASMVMFNGECALLGLLECSGGGKRVDGGGIEVEREVGAGGQPKTEETARLCRPTRDQRR